jgi:mono/diheme cytochrome c family protein
MLTKQFRRLALFAVVLGVCGVAASQDGNSKPAKREAKSDVDKLAEAAAIFQRNCANCHHPPDAQFATDRAWLDQINRTA